MNRAKYNRFSIEKDIVLLRLTKVHNPFADCFNWITIAKELNEKLHTNFTHRSCKERVIEQMRKFEVNDNRNLKKYFRIL